MGLGGCYQMKVFLCEMTVMGMGSMCQMLEPSKRDFRVEAEEQ